MDNHEAVRQMAALSDFFRTTCDPDNAYTVLSAAWRYSEPGDHAVVLAALARWLEPGGRWDARWEGGIKRGSKDLFALMRQCLFEFFATARPDDALDATMRQYWPMATVEYEAAHSAWYEQQEV